MNSLLDGFPSLTLVPHAWGDATNPVLLLPGAITLTARWTCVGGVCPGHTDTAAFNCSSYDPIFNWTKIKEKMHLEF